MYYVYILTNSTNKVLYTGVTNNLVKRVYEHKTKAVKGFTAKYKTHKLIYFEETTDINVAIQREKQIKSFTRDKKINLINSLNPSWADLMENVYEQ